jgi:hypothetical protein
MIVEGCGHRMVESPCRNRGLEGSEVGRKEEVIGGIVQLEEGGHVRVLGEG